MIKIGFVDYYIDEWHSLNYPEKFAAASERIGIPCEVIGAFATLHTPPFADRRTTDEWCRDKGIKHYDDIAELAKDSDALIIFAPDDPEQHPALAQLALPFGKPTFIDKTFAASGEDAVWMIELAKKHATPMYSTSSLRYAEEVEKVKGAREVSVRGNYVHMKDYLVHTTEMVVTVLGIGASGIRCRLDGDAYIFDISYSDGRSARMDMAPTYTFGVNGENVKSAFFDRQIENILRFFNGEEPTVSKAEMLEVAHIIDAAKAAMQSPGEEIKISQ